MYKVEDRSIVTVLSERLERLLEDIHLQKGVFLEKKDEERLHQLRVAVRQSVVLMDEFAFTDENGGLKRYKKALKALISSSNEKRDVDVLIVKLLQFQKNHPKEKKQLFLTIKVLEKIYADTGEDVIRYLQDRSYDAVTASWRRYLKVWKRDKENIYAYVPYDPVFRFVIYKRFKLIRTSIKSLTDATEHMTIETMHRLRISYKKLRYLLENYASLSEEKAPLITQIREIKRLQERLGLLHDIHQQKQLLVSLMSVCRKKKVTAYVVEVLLPRLQMEERGEIVRVKQALEDFLKRKKTYKRLFRG